MVRVIARRSDDYRYIPLLWVALLVPGVLSVFENPLSGDMAYLTQICTLLGAALMFNLLPLKIRLIPGSVKSLRTNRLAREQFFLQNLHRTRNRTGVLLFVSVAERDVEIIADPGINEVVTTQAWQPIVNGFIKRVRKRQVAKGFLTAISA